MSLANDGLLTLDRDFFAMNTLIEVTLEHHGSGSPTVSQLLEACSDWFESVERRFSRFLPDSELQYMNRHRGKPTFLSKAMTEVLSLAEMYHAQTNGLFSYSLLDALQHAGYDRSFEQISQSVQAALPPPLPQSHPQLVLDSGMRTVRLNGHEQLDLGGIVKGWSVNRLAAWLQQKHQVKRGLINAGGDLHVWGGAGDGEPWRIGVADPWDDSAEIAQITLMEGAVATSSVLGRRWQSDHGIMHHLIDPRTMRPGTSDVVQCTVSGTNAMECEIWSKVVCIAGSSEAIPLLLQRIPHCTVLFVTHNREVHFVGAKDLYTLYWHDVQIDFFHTATERH